MAHRPSGTGCNSFCTRVFVMISYITNTSLVLQGYVLIYAIKGFFDTRYPNHLYAICLFSTKVGIPSVSVLLFSEQIDLQSMGL